jgi:hypothetical protein
MGRRERVNGKEERVELGGRRNEIEMRAIQGNRTLRKSKFMRVQRC